MLRIVPVAEKAAIFNSPPIPLAATALTWLLSGSLVGFVCTVDRHVFIGENFTCIYLIIYFQQRGEAGNCLSRYLVLERFNSAFSRITCSQTFDPKPERCHLASRKLANPSPTFSPAAPATSKGKSQATHAVVRPLFRHQISERYNML